MQLARKNVEKSTTVMRVLGWLLVIGLPTAIIVYPAGFLWGDASLPVVTIPHPQSPYDGLHPYLFMLGAVYLAWAILLIRGARDPRANAALFDWGILANLLHGFVMVPQSFYYPNEIAHLWADIPLVFVLCLVLWIYHPNRLAMKTTYADEKQG